ncbi:hypothetical protein RSAG8_04997, partial [Rhizoctonia solani AG-8 WAC10335]
MLWFFSALIALYFFSRRAEALSIKETSTAFELSNGRLSASMAKSSGVITTMTLDGQDLLGTGRGLYLDCSCTPAGFYTPGTSNPIIKSLNGTDSTGIAIPLASYYRTHIPRLANYSSTGQLTIMRRLAPPMTICGWIHHQWYNLRSLACPIHSDLTVDGITYNYMGLTALLALSSTTSTREKTRRYANPEWNTAFYDSIAASVPNYVTTSHRGTFSLSIDTPAGAKKTIAILSENGLDPQDNAQNISAYQYWGDVSDNGLLSIPRVKEGTYRLTVYADGIFGQYAEDGIVIVAGKTTKHQAKWTPETAGKELWRIGTPDKTAGEFLHGFAPDPKKPLHPQEYRIYWGQWDFPTDFPNGVNYTVGRSDVSQDWNYVHWSVFGPSYTRTEAVSANVNNWTINFEHASQIKANSTGTLTIQLAAAKSSR